MSSAPSSWQILLYTMRLQLRLLSRTWPARLADLLMPSAIALIPVLLGRMVGGEEAGFNFALYTGTANYAGFLLIGGGTFLLVTRAFWGFGNWLRQEMQSGVLETLYLTPTSMAVILAGVGLAFVLYSALIFIGAMLLGVFLFQAFFQTNYLALAAAFLVLGLPPLYGLALLYGALVLRLKETEAFIQLAQWLTTLLIGVYFPVTLFPPAVRIISLLFPPTWLTQGLRSTLLDIPYFSDSWWIDLGVLVFFCLVGPLLGYLVFSRTEQRLREETGLGGF